MGERLPAFGEIMKRDFRGKLCLALGGLLLGLVPLGRASSVTYTGTFTADDQVQEYTWTLAQNSQVLLSTDSYGGGTSNGVTTPAGGFVPVISLFSSTGTVIASDGGDGVCQGSMKKDGVTGMCDDAYISTDLAAGSYIVAVSEFFNVPIGPNLSDGFLMQGQGDFTGSTCGTTGAFYATDVAPCVERTGNFAVTLSTVPEPASVCLIAIPFLVFGAVRVRKSVFGS
jgi:hypothetical protein